jgi:hypothetical protein
MQRRIVDMIVRHASPILQYQIELQREVSAARLW